MALTWKRKWAVPAVLLAHAGCASSADQCDPRRVDNLFQAMGCGTSGWEINLQKAREELEGTRAYYLAEYERSEQLKQEHLRLLKDRDNLKQAVKQLQARIDRYRLAVAALETGNDVARTRQMALMEELTGAEARLREMNAIIMSGGDVRREFEKLDRDVKARLRAVENGARGTTVE